MPGQPHVAETAERASIASFVSSTTDVDKVHVDYNGVKTPVPELEGGALRPGGAPDLYSRESIGLLAQYAAVGVILGAFPRTIYPFMNNYLRLDGYQTVAAGILVSMPWSFKTFIGIISDSFPIYGFRRRPYMVFGWGLCFITLMVLAIMPVDDPYYRNHEDIGKNITLLPPGAINYDAQAGGAKYILLMMLASVGYVVADVAADGMVVEFAQREPENVRGTTQTMIYLTRTVFSIFSGAMIGFCLNGKDYGGEFDWSLKFNQVMGIISVAALAVIPMTIYCLQEEKVERQSFKKRCNEMWLIIQQRVVWQILAQKFFGGLFQNFGAAPAAIVQREWAKVQPLNDTIFAIIGNIIFACTLYLTKNYGLQWNWRYTYIWTTIFVVVVDATVSFITIFDVARNQWLWLGVPLVEEFPLAIEFIVSTFIVVEIADVGHEGLTYGLLTTVMNLSMPFSGSIYKNVDAYFDAFQDDVVKDTSYVRWQVAYTFIIMYVMKLLSMAWLVLLPPQKREVQELKRTGGRSKLAGALAIGIAGFALSWSIMTNVMSIFPATSCLKIAGGAGCKD